MQFKPEDIPQNISPSRSEISNYRKIINSSLERQSWKVSNKCKSSKKRFSAELNNSKFIDEVSFEENVTPTKINNVSDTADITFTEEFVLTNGELTPDKSGSSFITPVSGEENDCNDDHKNIKTVKRSRNSDKVSKKISFNNLNEKGNQRKKKRKTEHASGSITDFNLKSFENEQSFEVQENFLSNIFEEADNSSNNVTNKVNQRNFKNLKETDGVHGFLHSSSSNNFYEKPKKRKKSENFTENLPTSKLYTSETNQHFEEQGEYTDGDYYDDEYNKSPITLKLEDDTPDITNSNAFENSEIDTEPDNSPEYENMKHLEYINILNKRLYVLPKNSHTYFYGAASVKVLYGSVEILGYVLNHKAKAVNVYSPRGSSLLYMRALENTNQTLLTADVLTNLGIDNSQAENILQKVPLDSTLVLCDKEIKLNINFFEKYGLQQIFPKQDPAGFRFSFLNDFSDYNALKISDEWENLYKSILPSTKLFLCGGQGVGKSTLLRYLVNKLLMDYVEVRVIDLDPGQSEFTVPGCLSICTVREPVFGPNFTHIIKPDRCIFTSNLNVAHNPQEYLLNVKELLSQNTDFKNVPTLINYMGFVRGLGQPLAASVITQVNPTMVVQIQSQYQNKNFSTLLTESAVLTQAIFTKELAKNDLKYELKAVNSVADRRKGFLLQPRYIRELCVLAYLSSLLPSNIQYVTDPAVPIYKTDLKQLKLISNSLEVPPAVLNGNLVGLCQCPKNEQVFICKGWGIVRGINLSTNELFLLTPEAGDVLEEVTHLVLGSVALPPSFYMLEENVSGLVPYVAVGRLSSFSAIPKRSHICPANRKRMKRQNSF